MIIGLKMSHKQDFGGFVHMFFYFKKRSSGYVLMPMNEEHPGDNQVATALPIQDSGHLNQNEGPPNDSQVDEWQ